MEIILSEIQVIPVKPRNGLLAFSSFVVNDSFYVGDVAIYSRLDGTGYRLVYPVKMLPNGFKTSVFYPINRETAQAVEKQVVRAFLTLIEKTYKARGARDE